jgi:hypothetical protein
MYEVGGVVSTICTHTHTHTQACKGCMYIAQLIEVSAPFTTQIPTALLRQSGLKACRTRCKRRSLTRRRCPVDGEFQRQVGVQFLSVPTPPSAQTSRCRRAALIRAATGDALAVPAARLSTTLAALWRPLPPGGRSTHNDMSNWRCSDGAADAAACVAPGTLTYTHIRADNGPTAVWALHGHRPTSACVAFPQRV